MKSHEELSEARRKAQRPDIMRLSYAARQGDEAKLRELAERKADFSTIVTEDGETPLHLAAANGHNRALDFMATNVRERKGKDKRARDVNLPDFFSSTPLHSAARNGSLACVEVLVKHKADVNAQNDAGVTPLIAAVSTGASDVVSYLATQTKADVNLPRHDETTPVYIAVQKQHVDIAATLLNAKADAGIPRTGGAGPGATPLHEAAAQPHCGLADLLLTAPVPADVGAVDHVGDTALHIAARGAAREISTDDDEEEDEPEEGDAVTKFDDVLKLLVESGGDPRVVNAKGKRALDLAPKDSKAWKLMKEAKSMTLHEAVAADNVAVVQRLLARGVSPRAPNLQKKSAIDVAKETKNERILQMLEDAAGKLDQEVAMAAKAGDYPSLLRHLRHGGSADAYTGTNTPIMLAATHGHLPAVRHLIQLGANIYRAKRSGVTPLHMAADNGHDAVAALLLSTARKAGATSKADAKAAQDDKTKPPHVPVAKYLALQDSQGRTALHTAAHKGHVAVARVLLRDHEAARPVLKLPDETGSTPLHLAAAAGNWEVAVELVASGADVSARDDQHRRPADLAANCDVEVDIDLKKTLRPKAAGQRDSAGNPQDEPAEKVAALVRKYDTDSDGADSDKAKGDKPGEEGEADEAEDEMEAKRRELEKEEHLKMPLEEYLRSCEDISDLFEGAQLGALQAVRRMLRGGANALETRVVGPALVRVRSQDDVTEQESRPKRAVNPLQIAEAAGWVWMAWDLETAMRNERYALASAAQSADIKALEKLLQTGLHADVTAGPQRDTPLITAAQKGHVGVAEALLARFHADVLKANTLGHTPLHVAAMHGHTDLLEVLLEYGADVDARTPRGHTPIYVALEKGQLATARLLLAAGATIGQKNDSQTSLVGLAAANGNVEALVMLLDSTDDMREACRPHLVQRNKFGATPFYAALEAQQFDTVNFLMDYIVDHQEKTPELKKILDMQNVRGTTPAIKCAKEGWEQPLRRLLSAGVELGTRDFMGYTAVQYAVQKNRRELVELLVQHGAVLADTASKAKYKNAPKSKAQRAAEKLVGSQNGALDAIQES